MKYASIFFTALLVALIIDLVFAIPVMLLWNWLMPAIFGIAVISYLQALGLLLLCRLLFKTAAPTKSN